MTTRISGRVWAGLLLLAVLAVAAGCGSASSGGGSGNGGGAAKAALVSSAHNSTLGTNVLVNSKGMTLYTLSAERGGKFICTKTSTIPGGSAACVSLWKPVLTKQGAPTGIAGLGTVMRPDGLGTQVTYHGLPLYTFTGDHAAGSAAGNGFKDVGTWRAATTSGSSGGSAPATSSGGGYGYGY
jgi:predicted lipoprotein with Yx(FWY)xxD motif